MPIMFVQQPANGTIAPAVAETFGRERSASGPRFAAFEQPAGDTQLGVGQARPGGAAYSRCAPR